MRNCKKDKKITAGKKFCGFSLKNFLKTIEKNVEIYYNSCTKEKFRVKKRFFKHILLRRTTMSLKTEQKKFDDVKWYDSILAGEDRCGSYDFCNKCEKELEYPCARAKQKYETKYVRIGVLIRRKNKAR